MNKIIDISSNNWPTLRDKYLFNWPENISAYYTIDNYIKWKEKRNVLNNFHIYSLNNDWNDGTCVIIDRYQIFINTLSESHDKIRQILLLLNWKHRMVIHGILPKYRLMVLDVLKLKRLNIEFDKISCVLHIHRNIAIKLSDKIPIGITISPVRQEHANSIDVEWPYRHSGSLFLFKRSIELNPSVAAYDKHGRQMGYMIRTVGSVGPLHVHEHHRCKGIGGLLIRAMVKLLANLGNDIYCYIDKDDSICVNLLMRNGFSNIGDSYFIITEGLNWSDADDIDTYNTDFITKLKQ